jgi:DNA-binding GntR family transcriptional regulator
MERTEEIVPEPSVGRLKAPPLSDLAYEALRERIFDGAIPMGARLNEIKLADELGVSRGTVRMAFRRLADEGLAMERPRQGTFVRQFTAEDLIHVYNLRVPMEVLAARLVVRTGADLRDLEELAQEGTGIDGAALMLQDYRFHERLCALSGNAHLVQVYSSLQSRVRMALSLDNEEADFDFEELHRPLLEALASGDEVTVEQAVRFHILGDLDETAERLGADLSLLVR